MMTNSFVALRNIVALAVLVVMTSACSQMDSPTAPTPTQVVAPTQVAARAPVSVTGEGLVLVWAHASSATCPIQKGPLPSVVGTSPEQTMRLGKTVRAFWPLTPTPEPAHYMAQSFVIAEFVEEQGEWRLCEWDTALREQFVCTIDNC